MAEPIWDVRKTAHRTGLVVLVVVYMALLAFLLYGHSVYRVVSRLDLPIKALH